MVRIAAQQFVGPLPSSITLMPWPRTAFIRCHSGYTAGE